MVLGLDPQCLAGRPQPLFHQMRRALHDMLLACDSRVMRLSDDPTYQFREAMRFDGGFRNLSTAVSDYNQIAQTFRVSLDRVVALGWLPAELVYWSQIFGASQCIARADLGLHPSDTSRDGTPEFYEACNSAFQRISPYVKAKPYEAGQTVFSVGSNNLDALLIEEQKQGSKKYRRAGIEAIMAAMITAAYAAFETMASDLWIAAVNRHSILAARYLEKTDKEIKLSALGAYQFNASNAMGKILTETKKVSFQSFNDIKQAYLAAFRSDIESVFSDTRSIYKAEKIRHLIAHRGGIVDSKFSDEMKDFEDLKDIAVGQQLPFSGPLVADQIDACSRLGTSLFIAVDSWSATAPTG